MHRNIFNAVEAGEPEAAAERMRDHLVEIDEFATRLDVA